MGMLLAGLGAVLSLGGFVCWIILIVHAFQRSVGTGFLSLCVPCYILYFAFAQFEHPKKGLIVGGFLVGQILGGILFQGGMYLINPNAMQPTAEF